MRGARVPGGLAKTLRGDGAPAIKTCGDLSPMDSESFVAGGKNLFGYVTRFGSPRR